MKYTYDFGGFTPSFSPEESRSMRLLWGDPSHWFITPAYMREHAFIQDEGWNERGATLDANYWVNFETKELEISLFKRVADAEYESVSNDERGTRTSIVKGETVLVLSFSLPLTNIPRFDGKPLLGEQWAAAKWSKWLHLWYPGKYYTSVIELPCTDEQRQAADLQQLILPNESEWNL